MRHGIHTVIIPKDNEKDLEEIDQTVRKALNFVVVKNVETVLDVALAKNVVLDPAIIKEIPDDMKRKSRNHSIRQ